MLEKAILQYTKEEVIDNVHAVQAPQGSREPFIVFSVVSNNFIHAFKKDPKLIETRVQFSVFAKKYEDVKDTVKDLKDTYRDYVEVTKKMKDEHLVQVSLLENETDIYEQDTKLFHTALDVIFWHVED